MHFVHNFILRMIHISNNNKNYNNNNNKNNIYCNGDTYLSQQQFKHKVKR